MELYVKTVGDPNYDPRKVQSESEIAQLITQIETILFTNKGEVLGNPDFGCSLEDLIYSLNLNEFNIKKEINTQLNKYCTLGKKYNLQVDIFFKRGNTRDEAYIDITIDSKYMVEVYVN